MNPAKQAKSIARNADSFQRRQGWLAFPYAVVRKFGEDQAGNLAALIAYYGFFSVFPLLLVLVSVLGMVLGGHPALQQRVLGSALAEFPVLGTQLKGNIRALHGGGVTLAVGIALTLWSGLGVVKAAETAMNTVWNVPFKERPNFLYATVRALLMLAVLGIITLAAAVVAGVGTGGGSWWQAVLGVAASLLLNVLLFLLAFMILTAAPVGCAQLWPGAVVGAVAWTVLQAFGGYYVGHQLKSASEVYGTFALVIGLLGWIYLGAQVTLLAAEINVVRAKRLWPRSVVQEPPLTEADQRALRHYAEQEERRHDEDVHADFDHQPRQQRPAS